ncbi:MAG: methyltransferase domain-containing protein [Pseudomonadota bacterium]
MSDELPDTQAARVDWVIRAPTNEEMRRRYDIWSAKYDGDVGSLDDYIAPAELTKVAADVLDRDAHVIDAGAGTGLVGAALKDVGFSTLTALDYSAGMLELAEAKGIYDALHQVDLSKETALPAAMADALVTCGTTTQVPPSALRQYVRLVRSGGKIVFAVVTGTWEENGYGEIQAELEAAGRLRVVSKGAPFQMMPTTEPQFICEIWVMEVL